MMARLFYTCLTALIILSFVSTGFAEVVSFRRSFGGGDADRAFDIFVDGNGVIFTVGSTSTYGANPPNAFLTIFNSDNSHRCSVALDLGAEEAAKAVTVVGGRVFVVGETSFGPNAPNHFVASFDASTCGLTGVRLFDIGPDEKISDIALELGPQPSFYVVGRDSGGAYVAKLNATLNVVWARSFRVRSGNDIAHAVALRGGHVYIAGTAVDPNSANMFVSVFDVNGGHIATREFASSNDEEALDIVVSGGNIFVAGYANIPGRQLESVLIKLDSALNHQWTKAFGSATSNEKANGLTVAGSLVYLVGWTNFLGSTGVALVGMAAGDGSLSHAFIVTAGGMPSSALAHAAASQGSCVFFTGENQGWPLFYVLFDGQSNPVSFSIASLTPSVVPVTPAQVNVIPQIASYTPSIDTPDLVDAFYSRFCPDTLISTSTTTVTSTVGTTTTTTSFVTSTTTAYAIATTTITQTSFVIVVSTETSYTTVPVTTTTTIPTTQTTTTTTSTTTTLTTTSTSTVTSTQSTTQTLTAVTTIAFAEPVSTYILPMILLMIAVLLGVAILVGRRRGSPPPAQPLPWQT
ncbi:MAG: hypothetical protein QXY84_01540 [Candidatus Caldarchaeum sp.]